MARKSKSHLKFRNTIKYMFVFQSEDSPTQPQDRIRAIRSNFPNDPESPFYDTTGREMKPMARLYLTRYFLYLHLSI